MRFQENLSVRGTVACRRDFNDPPLGEWLSDFSTGILESFISLRMCIIFKIEADLIKV